MTDRDVDTQAWGREVYAQLSWFKSDRVSSAKIMVVGCGALGNEVLKNLVLFGVEHLVVVDFDHIEASNLTRSILFSLADAQMGRSKVEVAAERLKQINPAVQVLPIDGDIAYNVGLGVIKDVDVVIGCVDNRLARYQLNRLCMRAGVPWVDGGIEGLEGTARVFVPGKNCYACNLGPEGLNDLSHRISCSSIIQRNEIKGRVATTPVVASIIGAVQAQEALKLLLKDELEKGTFTSLCGKMFYYEGQHLTSRIIEFEAYDDDCPVHEKWSPIQQSELHTGMMVGEVLDRLAQQIGCKDLSICLRDFSFVDYLAERSNDRKTIAMQPSYKITNFVENHPNLSDLPWSEFYQHEYLYIDKNFPYVTLTLQQIGIPEWDILHVKTEKENYYVETLKTVAI
ncbi:MAG: ThiF family adenylyltransferase [Tannerellaceae bacterium]